MRTSEEGCDQPSCDIALDRLLCASVSLAAETQIWICLEIFIPKIIAERGESRDCGVRVRNGDDCLALPRYRIRLVAAFQHNELKPVGHFRIQEASHLLHRVRAAFVDVITAVAAERSADLKPYRLIAFFKIFLCVVEYGCRVKTAGTTDEHLSLILRVKIDECPAGEEAWLHSEGTVHPGFFRDGEHTLDLPHRKVTVQKSEHRGDTYAVIGPKRGVLGDHPAILDHIFNRILEEVVLNAASFLADHILMSLKDERRHILLAFAGLLDYADIVCLVGFTFKMPLLGETLKKGCHWLFVSGLPWNPCDLLED